MMDFERFEKKMNEHLEKVMFPEKSENESGTAFGFNYGARTMFNYAIITFMEMMNGGDKK